MRLTGLCGSDNRALPLLFNRLIFNHELLPGRLAPTLALLVASPAVLCLAWLQLTGRVDETYRIICSLPILRVACDAPLAASRPLAGLGRLVDFHLS
jgi:hypothetical protein